MLEKDFSPLKFFLGFSTVLDLAHPQLVQHHKTTAYISLNLAEEMGMEESLRRELLFSALVHDLGILSLKESADVHQIEATDPHRHAYLAYLLIKDNPFFEKILPNVGSIILYHHAPWKAMQNPSLRTALLNSIARFTEVDISLPSYILSLGDKVALLIQPNRFILHQAEEIRRRISEMAGSELPKEVVEAFMEVSRKESFWLSMTTPYLDFYCSKLPEIISTPSLDMQDCLSLASFVCDAVDFHSPFTAVHSQGVSAVAGKLAELSGFSPTEVEEMRIAGYLHDLGKLAIPTEILEKPGRLTEEEFMVVRAHPFYTYTALSYVEGCEKIRNWASFHHEHLDGTGYPFHLTEEEIDLGARIMAVADVFSALREYRPYRDVIMAKPDILGILRKMAEDRARDGEIVSLLEKNYEEIDAVFLHTQFATQNRYQRLWREIALVTPP